MKRLEKKPFAILGINVDPDKAKARKAVADDGATWPSIWDPQWRIAEDYVEGGLPTLYLLDGRGVVRRRLTGAPSDLGVLDGYVDELLQEMEGKVGGARE